MNNHFPPNQIDLQSALKVVRQRLKKQVKQHWLKGAVLVVFAYVAQRKDVSIDLYLNAIQAGIAVEDSTSEFPEEGSESDGVMNVSMLAKESAPPEKKKPTGHNLANEYGNLTYTEGSFATNDTRAARAAKRRKQQAYIKQFEKLAETEMKKYGIPASIILAQGLLESDAGDSRLAVQNNNHFGMKCFSRTCRKGHCSNFTDDSHKDFFRIYKNPADSYRAHSHLLQANRYKSLFKLSKSDYKGWAKGLKKAGYATDKHYAEKLINLIEELDLHQYDH